MLICVHLFLFGVDSFLQIVSKIESYGSSSGATKAKIVIADSGIC